MSSLTGITYLLRDNDGWWLCKSVPNDMTVWVDASTKKRMDAPEGFIDPWLNPALNTLESVPTVKELYDRYEHRLVPNEAFSMPYKLFIGSNVGVNRLTGNTTQQAFVYALVKPYHQGNSFEYNGKLWQKFSAAELARLHNELPDRESYTAREIRTMLALTALSYPAAEENSVATVPTLDTTKPVDHKTFYIPTIVSGSDSARAKVLGVEKQGGRSFLNYASRIMPGQTAQDAIRSDLKHDFNYHGRFTTGTIEYVDSIPDKQGQECKRYSIPIVLEDTFEPAGKKVFGNTLVWLDNPLTSNRSHSRET